MISIKTRISAIYFLFFFHSADLSHVLYRNQLIFSAANRMQQWKRNFTSPFVCAAVDLRHILGAHHSLLWLFIINWVQWKGTKKNACVHFISLFKPINKLDNWNWLSLYTTTAHNSSVQPFCVPFFSYLYYFPSFCLMFHNITLDFIHVFTAAAVAPIFYMFFVLATSRFLFLLHFSSAFL